jgi:hypothetical protein
MQAARVALIVPQGKFSNMLDKEIQASASGI